MRVRIATTALGITAVLLALPACSTTAPEARPQATNSTHPGQPGGTVHQPIVLSSAALEPRLLDEDDLGSGYLRKPEQDTQHGDATVIGCPALNKLGGDAATGGTLAFPHKATTAFVSGDNSSELSEELYSDSADKLSDGIARIFDAMTGCPAYQVAVGSTRMDVTSQKLPTPTTVGDERWSQLLTISAGGQSTVVKQTAIRYGSLLLVVSGSPALVDQNLAKALARATAVN